MERRLSRPGPAGITPHNEIEGRRNRAAATAAEAGKRLGGRRAKGSNPDRRSVRRRAIDSLGRSGDAAFRHHHHAESGRAQRALGAVLALRSKGRIKDRGVPVIVVIEGEAVVFRMVNVMLDLVIDHMPVQDRPSGS